ncbi:hypothetical protein AN641_04325 [Candidatus Epulonipiscioides gigas]|nr:hypothetical protein AN641_04325 [Epulopiscium sp. SCG-C07WGA-EpuloA2]
MAKKFVSTLMSMLLLTYLSPKVYGEEIVVVEKEKPRIYTVEKGDSLSWIAKTMLGDGSRYMDIYELNKDKITDPNLIEIGMKLKLPRVIFKKGDYENGKTLYFGQIHSHSNLSDGKGDIDEAYEYAKDVARLDFFAVTDHSNSFDNELKANIADGSMSEEWKKGQEIANKFNEPGIFTAIYAYEMTWSATTGQWGHITTYNTPGFETRNNKDIDLKNYYEILTTQPMSISQFNHPGITFGNFANYTFYSKEADKVINLIEVVNNKVPSYDEYTQALDMGWHLAPTNNQDNHNGKWGTEDSGRTVVEAKELTRDSIFDAIRNMRVYATEDENLEISYELNGNTMGSILNAQEQLNFDIKVEDPDTTDVVSTIELITDGGKIQEAIIGDLNLEEWKFSLNPDDVADSTYFYVKIMQKDKDVAVTAPIWIGDKENIGISSFTASSNKVIIDNDVTVDTVIYNNEDVLLENIKVEYLLNGESVITKNIDNIAPSEQENTSAKIKITKAGNNTIEAIVTAVINGAERKYTENINVVGVKLDEVTAIIIDGSKKNAYVSDNYKNNMNFITKIVNENDGIVKVNLEPITDELLTNYDLLIITDPGVTGEFENYNKEELNAIKKFVERGGNLIITSKGDYGDEKGLYGNAAQANAILKVIGATVRLNDAQLTDDEQNGGQNYKLYLDNFNKDSIYTNGIDFIGISKEQPNNKYSSFGGTSVLIKNPLTTEIIVSGHDTTKNIDNDKQNDLEEDENTVALAIETLPNGSKIAVAGSTFFSDFEMDPSSKYSNPIIATNILKELAPKKTKIITPIADIYVDKDNDNIPDLIDKVYTVEGIVTAGNAIDNNKFLDIVYLQDKTGGIAIMPISELKLKEGQKVQVTGTIKDYEGNLVLGDIVENIDVHIIDDGINPLKPTILSTGNTMLENNQGLLVKTTGIVTKIGDKESGNIFIDDGSGEAKIYIDEYIGSGLGIENDIFNNVNLGDTITVIGLSSENPDGNRIRVKNIDELVIIKD